MSKLYAVRAVIANTRGDRELIEMDVYTTGPRSAHQIVREAIAKRPGMWRVERIRSSHVENVSSPC